MATPDMMYDDEAVHYCAVHPDREATLRCNKCDRYMCVQCAVSTPVGYRCRECARQHQQKFFTATGSDYLRVAGICFVLTGLAAGLFSAVGGFLLFAIVLGLPAGGAIAEAALRATGRRRGTRTAYWGVGSALLGGLLGAGVQVYLLLADTYNQLLAQVPPEMRDELARQMAQSGVPFTPTLDAVFTLLAQDLGVLIFVGLIALAIYGRYKVGRLV